MGMFSTSNNSNFISMFNNVSRSSLASFEVICKKKENKIERGSSVDQSGCFRARSHDKINKVSVGRKEVTVLQLGLQLGLLLCSPLKGRSYQFFRVDTSNGGKTL